MAERCGGWRRRVAGWALVSIVAAAGGGAGADTEIDVAIPAEGGMLAGTLTMPAGDTVVPGVLLLAGSGPTDRDGNQPGLRNDMLRWLARGLGERGIATLRVDKRGIGESAAAGGDESALRFARYVADARIWHRFLAGQPRIGGTFLAGHSEGALIAMATARDEPVNGLVLLASPGTPLGTVLGRQLDAAGLPPPLLDRANLIIGSIERGEVVRNVPGELAPIFRPSVQPYLASLFAIDPVEALAATGAPALVVHGTHDLQIEAADAERLQAARPGVVLVMLDGVNHVLRRTPRERDANLAAYADPDRDLAPGVVDAVARFLQRRSR